MGSALENLEGSKGSTHGINHVNNITLRFLLELGFRSLLPSTALHPISVDGLRQSLSHVVSGSTVIHNAIALTLPSTNPMNGAAINPSYAVLYVNLYHLSPVLVSLGAQPTTFEISKRNNMLESFVMVVNMRRSGEGFGYC